MTVGVTCETKFLIGDSLNFVRIFFARGSVAKFFVPDWGDKVDSGIGLSYRAARLHRLAGGTTTLCWSQLYPPIQGL
jgi:hypothetical protein